jgi:adenylate cyclase
VEPSNATTELMKSVRSGRLDFPTATNLSPSDTRLSRIPEPAVAIESSPFTKVAILPLRSLSSVTGEGSDSLQHLWDGTVEDIRTSLTYFRNLSVLSTSVTKSFQEKYDNPIRSFHRELGVEYALEGSVRTLGENAVLNVQLVNAGTETQAWGRRFRFTLDNLLSVHDDIIARIVVSIDQSITKSKIVESARKGTKSLSAFDCWARANQLFSDWTSDSDEKSVEWLRKAIEIDKDYARAYSNWAGVCNSRRFLKPARPEVMRRHLDEALPLASKAVNLDPLDARSRVALGWALIHGRRFDDAWSQFSKAVDLNPYDTDTLIASAVASAYLARPLGEERLSALQLADQAMSLCPVHQPDYYHVYRSIALYLGNEFEEAAETVLPVAHTITDGFAWLAASLVELGQLTEARFAAGEFLDQARKTWADTEPPSDEDILMWVWDVTPLQDDEKRSHLRKALATAGLEGSRAAKAAG